MALPFHGISILQDAASQAVSFAADALQKQALALFDEHPRRVLELGSGCGIVSLMLALQRPLWDITGIEIQPHLHELSLQNTMRCNISTEFLLADLKLYADAASFDLIIANPPWMKAGSGMPSPDAARNISRVEIQCTVSDVCSCISRNLGAVGQALIIYPAHRDQDVREVADKSLLDIIGTFVPAETNKYIIYRMMKRG